MARIEWDQTGERQYEAGLDHGVLYLRGEDGTYDTGVAWNGLVGVTESPSGAEPQPQYADNIEYLTLFSAERFGGTIEAFTYPDEFEECDGSRELAPGVTVGQQNRRPFGLSYRSLVGDDVEGLDAGYKIGLVYGATAGVTEKSRGTINESPEAITFSWEFSTSPVDVPGFKPTAIVTLNSTKMTEEQLDTLESILYGDETTEPRLPLPEELITLLNG